MSVAQMPDGRWYAFCRYRDFTGNIHQKKKTGFKRKKDAVEWLKQFVMSLPNQGGCKGMTVSRLGELYIQDAINRKLKKTTIYSQEHEFIPRVCKYIGERDVAEFTAQDASAFCQRITAEYTFSIARSLKSCVSSLFNFAMRQYQLPHNPFEGIRLRRPNQAIEEDLLYWTPQQFETFYHRMMEYYHHHKSFKLYDYAMVFYIAFWTGMRRGEILALRVKDVDFEKKVIHVRQNRTQFNDITTLKTIASRRDISMPNCLVERFSTYVSKVLYKPSPNALIFEDTRPSCVSTIFSLYRKRFGADLPPIHLHSLRHSHASLLIDLDIPSRIIADRLGHMGTNMLDQTYGHIYEQRKTKIAEKLDQINDVITKEEKKED